MKKLFVYLQKLLDKISVIYYGFNNFTFLKKSIIVVSSFTFSLSSVLLLFQFVDIPMQYKEFIVGSSTWRAEGKTVDLIAGPLFVLVFVLSFGVLSFFLKQIEFKKSDLFLYKFKENSIILKAVIFLLILAISFFYFSINKFYENDLKIDISVVSTVSSDYQIFYDTGSGFNEKESIRKNIGNNTRFVVPESRISRFRIDSGSKPGVIEINKICLTSGKDILCFSGEELVKYFKPVNHISSFELIDNNLKIHSTGNDPHFIYAGGEFPYSVNLKKLGFFFSIILLALLFVIFFTKVVGVSKRIYTNFFKDYKYWLAPFIIIPIELYLKRNINFMVLLPSIYALSVGGLTLIYSFYRKKKIEANYVNYSVISSIMFMIMPLSVFSLFHIFGINFINSKAVFLWSMIVCICNLLSVTIFYDKFKKHINKIFLFAQLSLPFLFLGVIPKKLITENFGEISYNYSWTLYLFPIFLAAIALFDILRRYYKWALTPISYSQDILKFISPIALFALLIVLKFSLTATPSVSTDDYHFGEYLLGTWSYLQGVIPYVDYTPAHGLFVNDFASLLNIVLFDGLAGSFNQARIIATVIICLIAFLSINYYLKNIFLAFIIILIFPVWFNWIVLIPFICLWLETKLLNKPSLWISIFMITSPLLVLFVPPQGAVLVAPFLILFVYSCYQVLKKPCLNDLKLIAFSVTVLLVFIIFTPFLSMFISACMYVLENASTNQPAYGISIFLSWGDLSHLKIIVREIMRNSWAFFIVASFLLALINFKNKNKKELLKFVVLPLFIMLMISYAMGRIDPGYKSRPFILSSFAVIVLLPIIIYNAKRYFIIATLLFFYASFFNLIPNISNNISTLLRKNIDVGALVNGGEYGLDNLGFTAINQDQLERLKSIKQILDIYISQDETYLDLTSRNAQYFYLDKVPPVSVTAPYNMVPIQQQIRAINDIEKQKIKVSLFSAENIIHDGGGLALRTPLLFRYIYLNYTPFDEQGIIYGIRSELLQVKESNASGLKIVKDTKDNNTLELLDKSFATKNLSKIPISWGKSYNTLKRRLTNKIRLDISSLTVNDLEHNNGKFIIKGDNPSFNFTLNNFNISGLDAGILVIDIDFFELKGEPLFKLTYNSDNRNKNISENYIHFIADSGFLIIPLDSQPRWLDIKKIQNINLLLENPEVINGFKINSIGLYQRKIFEENDL